MQHQRYPVHPPGGSQVPNGFVPNQMTSPPNFTPPQPMPRASFPNQNPQQPIQPNVNQSRPQTNLTRPSNVFPPQLSKPTGPAPVGGMNQIQYGTPTNLKQPLLHNQAQNRMQPSSTSTVNSNVMTNGNYTNAVGPQVNPQVTPMRNGFNTQTAPGVQHNSQRRYPSQVPTSIPTSQYPQTSQTYNPSQPRMAMPQANNQMNPQMVNTQTQPRQNQSNYPQMPQANNTNVQEANQLMKRLTVEQSQTYGVNLIEQKQIVSPQPIQPPKPPVAPDLQRKNVKPRVMRCTFNAIPQTSNLLKQSKLPFGVYIHPFIEDTNIPVISSVITRCRSCRSYLNPFVSIIDHRRWQCNMCYRINDIPEELTYDYSNRQYQDVRKRPELNYGSVEFIAPSEYMLRPPQPSIFLFVLDVSYNAIGTGYLHSVCEIIGNTLNDLPGDSRKMVGFITFNSSVHFYSLKNSQSQPQMYMVSDLDDIYLPVPDGLLVNVKENKDMILQFLETLPTSFNNRMDTKSAAGTAMQAARKMVSSTGGRITVFQTCLPNIGPGKLSLRENSNMSANSKDVANLNPTTDFYKKLALECAGEQVAIDLFVLAGQYCDLGSMSGVSRYSSGAIHYFPDYHHTQNLGMVEKFKHDFKRYLTRSIGFEAVMRLRCTKGMSINTFHGNFFVRSTDLLSLPNVNPDHSFSMQIDIEDNLTESSMVAFQAALLYTTTKGERRIRVHTMSLPVTSKLSDIYAYADQEAVVASLSKLASDRTLMSSLGDAREALINACADCLKSYRNDVINQRHSQSLIAPYHLRLLPLNILAMMKNEAFRLGGGVSLDQRVFSLLEFKWQPLSDTLLRIYPRVYPILDLIEEHDEGYPGPPILSATAERLSRQGIYLMDNGRVFYLFVGRNVADEVMQQLFNVASFNELPERMNRIPELDTDLNKETRKFVESLRKDRTFYSTVEVIREDQKYRMLFLNNLLEDRTESSMSYHEFLQHIQRQING